MMLEKKLGSEMEKLKLYLDVTPNGEAIVVTEEHPILKNSFRTYRSDGKYWFDDLFDKDSQIDIAEILDN